MRANGRSAETLYRARRAKNLAAQALAALATLFGLFWLAWIVWTTLSNGIAALDLDLFTKMTPPPGDDGGLLNAIFGSIAMSLLGVVFGAPIGVLELVDASMTCSGRVATDGANTVPSLGTGGYSR